jgi:gliding motility-associated-like protein
VQDSVLFTAYEGVAATHPPPYTFSYTLNGVAQTATTTSTSDSVWVLTSTTPGTYTYELLSVTDANGASVNISCNNTRVVEVQAAPVAQFTASPSSGIAPLEVTTQNQSSNATQYEWFVNGGWLSGAEAPTLTLEEPNTYVITLIAYNDLGCSDTTVQTVYVFEKPDEELQVVIPNVFTPNNDGINDWFGITANVSVHASVVILNRWGNVVFEKEFVTTAGDFVELWDGALTGSVTTPGSGSTPSSGKVPDGVYFYRVVMDGEGWSEEFTGFVTVKK